MAQLVACSTLTRYLVGSSPTQTENFDFSPMLRDWVVKGPGMSSRAWVTG